MHRGQAEASQTAGVSAASDTGSARRVSMIALGPQGLRFAQVRCMTACMPTLDQHLW